MAQTTETTKTTETTETTAQDALRELAIKVFTNSGDQFFLAFKKMHEALLKTALDVFGDYDKAKHDDEADLPVLPTIDENKVKLLLRLWANDLKPPTSRKRRRTPTLYQEAKAIEKAADVGDKLTLAAARAVCLELAWDHVQTECGTRLQRAEDSEHWDESANDERASRWGERHDAMDRVSDGTLSMIAKEALEGKTETFVEYLGDQFEELECE